MSKGNISNDEKKYVVDFWNAAFAGNEDNLVNIKDGTPAIASADPFELRFLELFGDVTDRDVLEIGCGLGDYTMAFAKMGARVTSIDISSVAVEKVRRKLETAGLVADVRVLDVFDIKVLSQKFDMIVGKFILHHLEPFDKLSEIFASCLKPEGKLVFAENNARNPLLTFARDHLAGRYGIPKHGDDVEYPLTPAEVNLLKERFSEVGSEYPTMIFFRMLNTYIFRGKNIFRPFMKFLDGVDNFLWLKFPNLRKFSYNQIVFATSPKQNGSNIN